MLDPDPDEMNADPQPWKKYPVLNKGHVENEIIVDGKI